MKKKSGLWPALNGVEVEICAVGMDVMIKMFGKQKLVNFIRRATRAKK